MDIRETYNKICDNGVLKEELNIVEKKGLIHALDFPKVFKMEWIKLVLRKIHDGYIWLEGGPIKITKRIIYRVIGCPTLDQPMTLRSNSKEVIEKNTSAQWNKRGMTIETIKDPLIEFVVRVISCKLYQSRKLNSVPCIAINVGYKIVKKDHTYDLVELQLQ